jgi:hypothetical protein
VSLLPSRVFPSLTTLSSAQTLVIGEATNACAVPVGGFHNGARRLERVTFQRGIDGSGDPLRAQPLAGEHEIRLGRSRQLATGTLACPECDAPVAPSGRLTPADPLLCPYCLHHGRAREFLSLAPPSRPARVVVTVTARTRALPG